MKCLLKLIKNGKWTEMARTSLPYTCSQNFSSELLINGLLTLTLKSIWSSLVRSMLESPLERQSEHPMEKKFFAILPSIPKSSLSQLREKTHLHQQPVEQRTLSGNLVRVMKRKEKALNIHSLRMKPI